MTDEGCIKYDSPIGRLTLIGRGGELTALYLPFREAEFSVGRTLPIFEETVLWLDRYFSGEKPSPKKLRLAPEGSSFRQAVWKMLIEIPYGETVTYGEIARRLAEERGTRISAQAVGGAVGHNPISIIIPCHRVIGAGGNLTGYGGGLFTKKRLLIHEGAYTENMTIPEKSRFLY